MDYKNFFLRSFFSFLFIAIFIFITIINFNYIFYLILILYVFVFIEIYFYFNKFKIIPLIYILLSLIFFLLIDFNSNDFKNFNIFVFIVVTFDSFSYIIGKTIGKLKLTNISPNKTVEGFIGGFLISFLSTLFIVNFLNIPIDVEITLYIAFIILSAFFGDLIESFFKRKNNLKNSSEFIPGHGGIFDRFDSFLSSIIFYSIFINFTS